jgi:hypothetical protein
MASILKEYRDRKLGILELKNELKNLIGQYNKLTGRYLFVYAADINKQKRGIDVSLEQDDFYIIQDILRESKEGSIDFYIETPGGSGPAAEEIAVFLRKKFTTVNFIIAAEAKSAGTILVLSGDNIYMTDTGSLGPIDAQIKIGRSVVSAHDYKVWVDAKRKEAMEKGKLNPFDAVMIAQISPGELSKVTNLLEFAKDLVKEWLEKYKFKNWTKTKTKGEEVTQLKRKARAEEVAEFFCNHTELRTHGRSLKIDDLKDLLEIEHIDADPKLADIVYRIKVVIRQIFDISSIYKLYYLVDFDLEKTAVSGGGPGNQEAIPGLPMVPKKLPEILQIDVKCQKCGIIHRVNGYIGLTSEDIKARKLETNPNINDQDILICNNNGCNFANSLKPIKAQVEHQTKVKLSFK